MNACSGCSNAYLRTDEGRQSDRKLCMVVDNISGC